MATPSVAARPIPERRFIISTVFAYETCASLTRDKLGRERMSVISGPETKDGTVVLSIRQDLMPSQQERHYVKACQQATPPLIHNLVERDQHRVWGIWHNHPTFGKASTRPSQTDWAMQDRLVRIGMPHCLGGIASLDGWLRLYSSARPFSVELYGSGAEVVETSPFETIIKLEQREVEHVQAAQ